MLREQRAQQPEGIGIRRSRRPQSAGRAAPVSASRHGVGHFAGLHPEDRPESTAGWTSQHRRPHAGQQTTIEEELEMRDEQDEESDDYEDVPATALVPRSARRYHMPVTPQATGRTLVRYHYQPVPPRSSLYAAPTTTRQPERETAADTSRPRSSHRRRRRPHGLVLVGLGMLVMLLLWQGALLVEVWWQRTQDDWHYGIPRTYQTDAVVGHFDSAAHPSHFEAENLHRHIVIFELPGGDASKARVYVGPLLSGPGADLAPVTLTFPMIGGKPAMVVTVGEIRLVYLNKQVKGVWQFVQQSQG